jgi:hypothetical protein
MNTAYLDASVAVWLTQGDLRMITQIALDASEKLTC